MEKEKCLMVKSDKGYSYVTYQENTTTSVQHKVIHNDATMVSLIAKHEVIDSGFENKCALISNPHNSQVPAASNVSHVTAVASNNSVNSPKMGSRRIFTPQFKLQVLESYRNDHDCKGNQRATARKYNIHRRQIQKWLQCESNLRSSVANINQSNVKHQFHNISHNQHHPQQLQLQIAAINNNKSSFSHHQLHHQHQLSLDSARQSVALNSMTVPSNAQTQGVLAAAKLAAVVAAATAAGAAGAIAIASSSTTNTSTQTASPLRPTAIGGSSCATMSPSMLHPHHHHHYPMPYTHTPASVSVSMPILTHHIPPQHLQHHYQYHNLSPHAHVLPQAHQPSAFMPSTCLPASVMSAAASASITTTAGHTPVQGESDEMGEEHHTSDELRESSKATIAIAANLTGNSYVYSDKFAYKCTENNSDENHGAQDKGLSHYPYIRQPSASGLILTPMDLSLGSRRDDKADKIPNIRDFSNHIDIIYRNGHLFERNDNSVVDLTFRKRKIVGPNMDKDEQPDKLLKFLDQDTDTGSNLDVENEEVDSGAAKGNVEDDIIVEVEQLQPIKPVKLFKPYLLDDEDKINISLSDLESSELEPIVQNNHKICSSPHNYDNQPTNSPDSNFQLPSNEKYTFPDGSPIFPRIKQSSTQKALTFISLPALSPTSFRCPKGSPVSGYESSSSTYSESSFRSESFSAINTRTFSLDFQMHAGYTDIIPRQNHVQRWLDQDTNTTPPKAHASIALYA